ncbi:MAG: AcrR family transcriptional regulator [Halioglobus sp.]|jgi:AcrR family transcriptional regulator
MNQAAIKPKKREVTRAKVIRAAINRIYTEGFNAAHTNRIAEEAGVSWGVLQYHFGDKDGLLEAVLDHIFDDFASSLSAAQPGGEDLRGRIDELIALIWSLVGKPEYRVSMAILRNAGHSPESRVDGAKQVEEWAATVAAVWDDLFADIDIPPGRSRSARRLMFASLRGFADDLNPGGSKGKQALKQEFSALGDAIHYLLTQTD